jgi:hypothetical protein
VSAPTDLSNETEVLRIVFASLRHKISEATSLKNETKVFEHDFLISSLKMKPDLSIVF